MPRHPDDSVSYSTLSDFIDDPGWTITVHCNGTGCHHSAAIDLVGLAERVGRDFPCLAKDLKPMFKCGKCGSKDIKFTYNPPTKPRF